VKIFKGDNEIAEMPDRPQNLDAGCKGGTLSVVIDGKNVVIGRFPTQQQACHVLHDLCQSYLHGHKTFNLP